MKKLLTSVTAVSVLGMSVLFGGLTVHAEGAVEPPAEQRNRETHGTIKFIPSLEPIEVIPPVEGGPDVDIPTHPGPGSNLGGLTIATAPNLNFGEHVVQMGAGTASEERYPMIAEMQTLKDSTDKVPYVSFVQVFDLRGTHTGWTLSVSASTFDSNAEYHSALPGTRIEFASGALQYDSLEAQSPTIVSDDSNNILLETTGDRQVIMHAAVGKGAGISSLVWGNQTNLNDQFRDAEPDEEVLNNAINLIVPAGTILSNETYTSQLNWQLADTPHNVLPQ